MRCTLPFASAIVAIAILPSACGKDATASLPSTDPAEDECAEGVTYRAVAKPFLDVYCRSCHGGAPVDGTAQPAPHTFPSERAVRQLGAHIHEVISERTMPPPDEQDLPRPSNKERRAMLGWLECSGALEDEATEGHTHD